MSCFAVRDLAAETRRPAITSSVRQQLRYRLCPRPPSHFTVLERRRTTLLTREVIVSSTYASIQSTRVSDVEENSDSIREPASKQNYKGKTAVVVGAGPAGAAAAAYLSRHGFTVKIYEKRGDLRFTPASSRRSYSIGLHASTAEQMRDLGVDLPPSDGGYLNGLHAFHGSWSGGSNSKPFLVRNQPNKLLGNRYDIAKALLNVVETHYAQNVEFHFGYMCMDISFPEQRITFQDNHGSSVNVDYDLLVAADGTNSIVRKLLSERDKDFFVTVTPNRGQYISVPGFHIPKNGHVVSEITKPGWLWMSGLLVDDRGRRDKQGTAFLSMQDDGTVRVALAGLPDLFQNIKEKGIDWTRQILPKEMPTEWKDRLHAAVEEEELGSLPPVVHVPRLIGPATMLIGDAAHGISPRLGYGCNIAVGDSKVLYEALEVADGDIDRALKVFNDMRYEEVHACQLMEEGWSDGMLQLGRWKAVWRSIVKMHTAIFPLLQRLIGKKASSLRVAVVHEQISPKEALFRIRRDCVIFFLMVLATTSLLIWTLFK